MKTLIVDRPETVTISFPCDLKCIGLPGYKIYQDGLVISTKNNQPLTVRNQYMRFYTDDGKRVALTFKKIMFCLYNKLRYSKVVGMHIVISDDGHIMSMADRLREVQAETVSKRTAPIPAEQQIETIDRTLMEMAMLKQAVKTNNFKPIAKYLSEFEEEMLKEIKFTRRVSSEDTIHEIWHAAYEHCLKEVMKGKSSGTSLLWKLKSIVKSHVILDRQAAKRQDRQLDVSEMRKL